MDGREVEERIQAVLWGLHPMPPRFGVHVANLLERALQFNLLG
jgi:hypothetical protein